MTVGFGDIAAENTAEMLFCIVAEWTGALVFAFIISQVLAPKLARTRGESVLPAVVCACDVWVPSRIACFCL